MLSEPIPDDWPAATYEGFNFITDAESPAASEIAVFGVKPTDPLPPGQYYAAPTDSDRLNVMGSRAALFREAALAV
jgi:hypothetical protein